MSDELPNLNVTRGEKALAGVLVVFLLIGGLWMYFVTLERDAQPAAPTAAEQRAIDAHSAAVSDEDEAANRRDQRNDVYERAREEYRTDLDADRPATASRAAFVTARARIDAAERELREARAKARRLEPAAARAQDAVAARDERASETANRTTALLRLGWVLGCLALAFWLFN